MTKSSNAKKSQKTLPIRNPHAAGIDVGADEVVVAVPEHRSDKPVRSFGTTSPDLQEMAKWLCECGIETVAMESTGVYWMPVFSALEDREIDTYLVDARRVKNVPGRKTDVCDAQWLQKLHSFGLLNKAVVLPEEHREVRTLLRLRETQVKSSTQAIQRIQKTLTAMNIRLDRIVNDITGATGMRIIKAILEGKTSPEELASLRHGRCKHDREDFVKALTGRPTQQTLFALREYVNEYEYFDQRRQASEREITSLLERMPKKKS